MNRKMPYDHVLFLTVLTLLGFGLVMVSSASPPVSKEIYGDGNGILFRQLIAVCVGIFFLLAALKIDYHLYTKPWIVYSALALTVALMVIPLALPASNGVSRWIRIGPAQFQPSELAKLAAILFTAFYLCRYRANLGSFLKGVLPHLAAIGALIALTLAGSDLGTAVCIALVAGLMLYLGGLNYKHLPILGLLGAVVFGALVILEPYRLKRILSFFQPGQDPAGADYQIQQSLIAVGSGGFSGVGFADGTQKLHYLPVPHSDFIFAVIGEELGLLGTTSLILLFILFLWRGVRVARKADTLFGLYLGLGIVGMVVLQALINISVVLHLLPTKGIPLPFISVGGSSMLVMLTAVGILLNISKHGRKDIHVGA